MRIERPAVAASAASAGDARRGRALQTGRVPPALQHLGGRFVGIGARSPPGPRSARASRMLEVELPPASSASRRAARDATSSVPGSRLARRRCRRAGEPAAPSPRLALGARRDARRGGAGRARRQPMRRGLPPSRRPRPLPARRRGDQAAQPLIDLVAVVAPQVSSPIAATVARSAASGRPPLRRIERPGLDLARPEQVDERQRGRRAPRRSPPRPPERSRSSGSCPSGSSGEAQRLARLDQRQGDVERAEGRALPGLVAVEAQDRLVGHAPEQAELVLASARCRAARPSREAGQRHGDDVDIALDRDDRAALVRRPCGRRGGCRGRGPCGRAASRASSGIWPRTSLSSARPPKAIDAAARVGDREHHAVAETVVGDGDVVAGDQQARPRPSASRRDALAGEMVAQGVALARRIAEAESALRLRREAALGRDRRGPRRPARPVSSVLEPGAPPVP